MTADPQGLTTSVEPRPRSRAASIVRLILAFAITLAVLPYAWGRTLVFALMTGRPELPFVLMLALGLLAVMLLTAGLSRSFIGSRLGALVPWAVALSWVAVAGVLISLFAGALLPLVQVVPLFILGTVWVPWTAWMLYAPLNWDVRLGVLALLAVLSLGFPLTLKPEGLTGEARVDFRWRSTVAPADRPQLTTSSDEAALTTTVRLQPGPHDYAQFLGPQRLGVISGVPLARNWKQSPPKLLWRQPLGAGWSAFAVVGAHAFTQEQRGAEECVVCYRLSDGARMWLHSDPVRFDSSMGGPGPRATPTVTDGKVYAVGATGLLNCLEGATGKRLWSVDILADNQADNLSHGVCGSPLVVDDKVLVCPTGANGLSLVAYHRDTGQRLWQGGQDRASYGSPLVAELAGVRQVLLYNNQGVAGHDLATGMVLWRFEWTNEVEVNCSQPIPHAGGPDQVFVSTGYSNGCALIRVERSSDGSWAVQKLWSNRHLKTKFTTAVLYGSHVYGLDDGIFCCVDLATGNRAWKAGRYQHGQVLLAGDLILVQAENGTVILVEPAPAGLRELGRLPALSSKTWNNPALAGRYLLVRNDQEAACYELSVEGN